MTTYHHVPQQRCARCGGRLEAGRWADSICAACATARRREVEGGRSLLYLLFAVWLIGVTLTIIVARSTRDVYAQTTDDLVAELRAVRAEATAAKGWARVAAGVPDWVEGPVPDGWSPGLWCGAPETDGARVCVWSDLAEHGVTRRVPIGWYCDAVYGVTCGPVPDGWRCGPVPDGWRCKERP